MISELFTTWRDAILHANVSDRNKLSKGHGSVVLKNTSFGLIRFISKHSEKGEKQLGPEKPKF